MKKYIDADKLKEDVMSKSSHLLCEWDTAGVLAAIDRQETADVRPERYARWESASYLRRLYKCSFCGVCSADQTLYCSYCGAKMDGKDT